MQSAVRRLDLHSPTGCHVLRTLTTFGTSAMQCVLCSAIPMTAGTSAVQCVSCNVTTGKPAHNVSHTEPQSCLLTQRDQRNMILSCDRPQSCLQGATVISVSVLVTSICFMQRYSAHRHQKCNAMCDMQYDPELQVSREAITRAVKSD